MSINEATITSNSHLVHGKLHRSAVISFILLLFLSCYSIVFLIIGYILFLLITSFHMIRGMLLYMALFGMLASVFPFLVPLFILLMIIFFFMRISFIIDHWRPILIGMILYGTAIVILNLHASDYFFT